MRRSSCGGVQREHNPASKIRLASAAANLSHVFIESLPLENEKRGVTLLRSAQVWRDDPNSFVYLYTTYLVHNGERKSLKVKKSNALDENRRLSLFSLLS